MEKTKLQVAAFIILFVGAMMYVFFREEVIFTEIISPYIGEMPVIALSETFLSNLIKYNLPDALWCLGLLIYATSLNSTVFKIISIIIPPLMELLQYFRKIPGTFDLKDLTIYLILISSFVLLWKKKKNGYLCHSRF